MRFALTPLVLLLFVLSPLRADQVLSVVGNVTLTRNQQQYQARNRAYLTVGDILSVRDNSGVSFALKNAFVYTGPNTSVRLDSDTLHIDQGQVRIITRPNQQLTVITPNGNMFLNGGIHRIGVSNQNSRFAAETGPAELQWIASSPPTQWSPQQVPGVAQASYEGGTQSLAVIPEREYLIVNGRLMPPDPRAAKPWNINVAMLQQQAINNSVNELNSNLAATQDGLQGQTGGPATGQGPMGQVNGDAFGRQPVTDDVANAQRGGVSDQNATNRRRPDATTTQYGATSVSSIFSGFSASAGTFASGGLFADANQATNQGMIVQAPPGYQNGQPFPGNIFPLTADMPYELKKLQITSSQLDQIFAGGNQLYFSVGVGDVPTSQVSTDFSTGTGPVPHAVKIPGFNNYVVQLDQYGITDPIDPQAINSTAGITGLTGSVPSAPSVSGATPTIDERAIINQGATFALGEFRMARNGDSLDFAVRRSDQDRRIVKDVNGNDANDQVTPNPDVQFEDVVDPRFLPAAPMVKQPIAGTFNKAGTNFSELNNLRRAAATTILADQLFDVASQTGQTRFAIDGKIIDISGFRR